MQNAGNVVGASGLKSTFLFVPVVDGTFIVERPTVTLKRRAHNGVCTLFTHLARHVLKGFLNIEKDVLLAVTNANDGYVFVSSTENDTTQQYIQELFPELTVSQTQKAATYYTALNATLATSVDQARAVMGEGQLTNIF